MNMLYKNQVFLLPSLFKILFLARYKLLDVALPDVNLKVLFSGQMPNAHSGMARSSAARSGNGAGRGRRYAPYEGTCRRLKSRSALALASQRNNLASCFLRCFFLHKVRRKAVAKACSLLGLTLCSPRLEARTFKFIIQWWGVHRTEGLAQGVADLDGVSLLRKEWRQRIIHLFQIFHREPL